jgi:glycosyltransferase involved in cell wall biosynthesis
MSLGKPVIATGYSGNMDFMNSNNSILVPFELVPVAEDAYPYPKDSRWAQPDIEFAADAMRTLSLNKEKRLQIGNQALSDVTSQFTMERAAEFARVRVEDLTSRWYFKKLPKLFG